MSHFMVSVILPRLNAEAMNAEIGRLMEPFSENLDVPEYDRPCYCVNGEARAHGRAMANKLVGGIEGRLESFSALPEVQAWRAEQRQTMNEVEDVKEKWAAYDRLDEIITARWQVFNAEYWQQFEETRRDYTENHPRYNLPKTDCDECHGTGTYKSTYNPKSKWDWYRIGGRFDGLVTETPQQSENGFNFDAKHETLANNSVPVQELLDRHAATGNVFRSYAIVTPDGEWIEQGQVGWWGMSSGELPQNVWDDQLLTIYRKYAAFDIVLLDCHI